MRMYSSGIYIQFRACSESRYIMKGVQRGEIRTGGKGLLKACFVFSFI